MQIDSSARPTCFRLRSTVECTATVLMPRLWQARNTRSAISPRLAMTTFSSMGAPRSGERGAGNGERKDQKRDTAALGSFVPRSPFPVPARSSGNHEHGFVEFHRLAVLDQDG